MLVTFTRGSRLGNAGMEGADVVLLSRKIAKSTTPAAQGVR